MPLSPWCVLVFGGRLFTDCSQRFGNRDVHFCQGSPAPRGPLLGGRVLVRTLGGDCVSDCRAAGQFECGALVSPGGPTQGIESLDGGSHARLTVARARRQHDLQPDDEVPGGHVAREPELHSVDHISIQSQYRWRHPARRRRHHSDAQGVSHVHPRGPHAREARRYSVSVAACVTAPMGGHRARAQTS